MADGHHNRQQQQRQADNSGQIDGSSVSLTAEVHQPQPEREEFVQVVYQSNENGALVGVESSLLGDRGVNGGEGRGAFEPVQYNNNAAALSNSNAPAGIQDSITLDEALTAHQQLQLQQSSRAASTLPSVAEESSSGAGASYHVDEVAAGPAGSQYALADETTSRAVSQAIEDFQDPGGYEVSQPAYGSVHYGSVESQQQQHQQQQHYYGQQNPETIYSTVNKQTRFKTFQGSRGGGHLESARTGGENVNPAASNEHLSAYEQADNSQLQQQLAEDGSASIYSNIPYNLSSAGSSSLDQQRTVLGANQSSNLPDSNSSTLQKHYTISEDERGLATSERDESSQISEHSSIQKQLAAPNAETGDDLSEKDVNEEISHILSRKGGAAESGSFRHNFRKKLGISVSSNENDLTAHRQKLLETKEATHQHHHQQQQQQQHQQQLAEPVEDDEPGSLPKFKRTHSVSFNVGSARTGRHSVDIRNLPSYLTVKRASIVDVAKGAMSSLMHSFGTGSSASSQRRDSSPDEEPIFEEPIAPTLSLGQRVAMVKNSGAEFGTVGWIGQLPDVDDDWIVGVIFDNMIGDCDGAHNGVRYFYARENYAMFVPLSTLTKTDNYIGRPETGTMLSRMSVSLKPGQLISIQRSSIRLQHCFLNAPHQRVGHDVRAVSNRLHCQCHNCGPCAHLTKQGRLSSFPAFGTHHAPNKKNSLAHAAVEILAHHHHHYHEEEHKGEEEYQFGDNSAHACNFVRYSCCQQHGAAGHDFSADCQMVRPELLDNLIHAPKAPHRRTARPRRRRPRGSQQQQPLQLQLENPLNQLQLLPALTGENYSTLDGNGTMRSRDGSESKHRTESESSYSIGSSSRSSSVADGDGQYSNQGVYQTAISSHLYDQSPSFQNNEFSTIDTRMSLIDQQRFIYQRESSNFMQPIKTSHFSDLESESRGGGGIGAGIRRCLACIMGRKSKRRKKPKKRKLSARNRMNEYRRRQSTFVPSTLAKPQEDFASHGIILPSTSNQQRNPDSNSDYSSYSKSSCSSRSSSPGNDQTGANNAIIADQNNGARQQQETMTILGSPNPTDQLKSCQTIQGGSLNYDDYTFSDGYGSYKKDGYSRESALTDLGYFDSLKSSSNDTLKQIIDQSINEQVSLPDPIVIDEAFAAISPILSQDGSDPSEQVDISSITASLAEQSEDCMCHQMGCLDLDNNNNEEDQDPSSNS